MKNMTKEEALIQFIVNAVANELLHHYDEEEPQLYRDKEGTDIRYMKVGDTDIKLTYVEAITLIKEQVIRDYTKYGKVHLYTCRDNALISLEYPVGLGNEVWDYCERQMIPGWPLDIFYIAFD